MSTLEVIELRELSDKAASLQNGKRGDKDVMNDVVALTAKMVVNVYHKIAELKEETKKKSKERRKFFRNNFWNFVNTGIMATAVFVAWIK